MNIASGNVATILSLHSQIMPRVAQCFAYSPHSCTQKPAFPYDKHRRKARCERRPGLLEEFLKAMCYFCVNNKTKKTPLNTDAIFFCKERTLIDSMFLWQLLAYKPFTAETYVNSDRHVFMYTSVLLFTPAKHLYSNAKLIINCQEKIHMQEWTSTDQYKLFKWRLVFILFFHYTRPENKYTHKLSIHINIGYNREAKSTPYIKIATML